MDQFWKNIIFHVLEAENGYELIFIDSFLCICKHKTLLDVVETYLISDYSLSLFYPLPLIPLHQN